MSESNNQRPTKECNQCHKQKTKDQFSTRQWRTKTHPSCRLCTAYTKTSTDISRTCFGCKLDLPRMEFAVYQWGKGSEARCHSCTDALSQKVLGSIGDDSGGQKCEERNDGILVCAHGKEMCDVCMVDYTLMNDFTRAKLDFALSPDEELTQDQMNEVIKANMKDVKISRKICIMDGQPVCPRSSRKMRCPCNEVTYCSTACQKHHWMIHKMTCKWYAKKEEKKAKKKLKKLESALESLTEEEKNYARMEAFFAENNGGEHSIEECAWQLNDHPFVIGGGSIRYGKNGEEFIKGDVAKIYREKMGVEWDGSPRFGMGPYEQNKPRIDWIAKAKQGKPKKMKDIESELMGMCFK